MEIFAEAFAAGSVCGGSGETVYAGVGLIVGVGCGWESWALI